MHRVQAVVIDLICRDLAVILFFESLLQQSLLVKATNSHINYTLYDNGISAVFVIHFEEQGIACLRFMRFCETESGRFVWKGMVVNMAVIGYAFLAAAVFIADLCIKNHIERTRTEGETDPVLEGRLLLRKYHNRGAFLDMGQNRRGVVAVLSLILTLGATVLFLVTFTFRGGRLLKTGLALLLGGAYSNTYDRLVRKYVVDYVSFPVKNKKIRNIVFNISDFCIMTGALLIVLGSAGE